ncbi:unnamed protein product, partial [Nippostrongylus brasiliensis]|uniref:Uncharacterized protein n=1 Tax=Nippostrongylus brasiliensis TaxID=27835 RepID=A0A0N4XRA6_NIPBR
MRSVPELLPAGLPATKRSELRSAMQPTVPVRLPVYAGPSRTSDSAAAVRTSLSACLHQHMRASSTSGPAATHSMRSSVSAQLFVVVRSAAATAAERSAGRAHHQRARLGHLD